MADPRATHSPPQDLAPEASVVARQGSTFVPRPPVPLPHDEPPPGIWDEPQSDAWNEPPQISAPPLRGSRKRRVAPIAITLLLGVAALGVGHHWYQRLSVVGSAEPTPTSPPDDAPFSLRAAWRDLVRSPAEVQNAPAQQVTPVISVLDEQPVADEPPAVQDAAPKPGAPTPAALLAERFASTKAVDSAAPVETKTPGSEPATTYRKSAPVVSIPHTPPPAALTPIPSSGATAETPQHARPLPTTGAQRVPGMVGLGGPPATESPPAITRIQRNHPLPTPKPHPPKSNRLAHPVASAATSGRHESSRSHPRKPYRRVMTSPPTAQAPPPEQPITGMSLFNRLGRTMP
ncbi:MAG: hypothetical protein AB7E81_18505 [Hyphomicrobiaceae bacterium]